MKTIKEEMTSASEAAAKRALIEFGEVLVQWWPAVITSDFQGSLSARIKTTVESTLDRILSVDLLGMNITEAEKKLSALGVGVDAGGGAKFTGKIGELAIKRGGPGVICEVSDEKRFDMPLPAYDKLLGNLDVDVRVSSQLLSHDRTWRTRAAIKITLTGIWSWEQDFGAPSDSR